ncbi:hypothetical protein OG500_35580 [Kitasatospora sp. NBC_01250]|uniref:hypothetical protein n=1 Tax=unclassified Kitasatospora TaxID=2633591 RepID=UPI002E143F1E|nr:MULTISPECIES: hypothetical protein [unclassified Kitasatospora]WSJ71269.1 hypothetical protein OG294_37085 [Kitasatospora sp. NBC_01302]
MPLTLHHIVPFSLSKGLAALWNAVAADGALSAAQPLLSAIALNVDRYGTNLGSADRERVKTIANGIKNGTITHSSTATTTPDGWDNFAQVYAWLPGNLFCGPTDRADAPANDDFDAPARLIIGTGAQYTTLQTADSRIRQYLADRKVGYAEQAYDSLGTVARSNLAFTPFTSTQWTWDSGRNLPKVKGS